MPIINLVYEAPEQGGRQPGANTLAYYPLSSTTTTGDESGNQNTLTVQGNVSFINNYAEFNQGRLDTPVNSTSTDGSISFWMNNTSIQYSENVVLAKWGASNNNYRYGFIIDSSNNLKFRVDDDHIGWETVANITNGTWYYIIYTWEGAGTSSCVKKVYVNGNTTPVINVTYPLYNDSGTYIRMGGRPTQYNYNGKISNLIVEDKVRTAQEISDYYNQTKGDYGIS